MKLKFLLAALAATLTLGSCTDFTNGFDAKSHEYKVNFEKQFGEIDPNQDWSMAAQTVANVNMPEIKGDAVISVFNGNPNASKSAKVLGRSVLKNGVGSFDFYSVKGVNDVYVQIKQGKKVVYTNRYDIKNSAIMIGDFATRSFTDGNCPTTQSTGDKSLVDYTAFNNVHSTIPTHIIKDEWDKKTVEDWKEYTYSTAKPGENYSPFTDESLFAYGIFQNFDFTNAQLNEQMTSVDGDGNITVYWSGDKNDNPGWNETHTLDGWKSEALNHISDFLWKGTWGPWVKGTVEVKYTPSTASDAGSIIVGFTDFSNWQLKSTAAYEGVDVYPTFQYLNNVETAEAPSWALGTGYAFFGDGSMFEESVSIWDNKKLGVYYDEPTLKNTMEEGYSITTTENQVIELPYIFGCTKYINQFGYVYYKADQEANIDPINLKHFVLIEDARPSSNIYRNAWKDGANSIPVASGGEYSLSDWTRDAEGGTTFAGALADRGTESVCYCDEINRSGIYGSEGKHLSDCRFPAEEFASVAAKRIYGTTYRPMFFGEDGNTSQGTYKWPAGYKIIFWINTLQTSQENAETVLAARDMRSDMCGHFNYSLPRLNKRLYHDYQGKFTDKPDDFGAVQTITWYNEGVTYLAFGDASGDKDLNDIVFMVKGVLPDNRTYKTANVKWHLNYNGTHDLSDGDRFDMMTLNLGASYTEPKDASGYSSTPNRAGYTFEGWSTDSEATTGSKTITGVVPTDIDQIPESGICYFAIWKPVAPEPTPEPQSWIFACEDLGGSFDYDFNDVVWEVSQTSTESDGTVTYGDIQVKILAAGGTLPIKLVYGSTEIGGEIHTTAFGQTADSDGKFAPVNVAKGDHPASYVLGTISAGGKKMDLTTLKANFKLIVSDAAGAGDFIVEARHGDENDKTPQILILPGGWRWPLEYKNIKSAYPKFTDWVKDSQNAKWTENKVDDLLIDQY